jgi:aminoglycoside phosphotransferase (APT) family kinase protein
MSLLRIRALLESTFAEEPALPTRVEGVQFLQRGLVDTYLVQAGGEPFVAQLATDGMGALLRLRRNLELLSALAGPQVPSLLAWREGAYDERRWALLVSTHVPGQELSPSTFNRPTWESLCALLEEVHRVRTLPVASSTGEAVLVDLSSGAPALAEVGEQLRLHLPEAGWPVSKADVYRQLDEMANFVDRHSVAFDVPPRLVHGDLSRSNIRVSGSDAGLVDWADAEFGDYGWDLGALKFALDSVAPRASPQLLQELGRRYRRHFGDESLEIRLRLYLALPGLVHGLAYAKQAVTFGATRAMRVRACLKHSQAQWRTPLKLDGVTPGAPAAATDHSWFRLPPGMRRAGSVLR